ncbi:hypothetical protein [Thioalkalivibrio sulfidiphilus]|uniref:hypothetical protein n=1 Tax=Thioalkalivibrio sulfidiphilus TaxID=1033854 RepID=UPI003B371097
MTTKKKPGALQGMFTSAATKAREAVEEVRRQIAETRREREALAVAPLTRGEVAARVDAWLDSEARRARLDLVAGDFSAPGRGPGHPFRVPVRAGEQRSADLGPVLAALFSDQVKAAILDALPADADAIPMADRPGRLAELDARVRELEAEEERLIEEAEAAGVEITRRPDASPEAILAVEWPEAAEA